MRLIATVAEGHSAPSHALGKAQWQRVLFAPRLSRLQLLRLQADWPCRTAAVRVHRNHAFELLAKAWTPFLTFADLRAELWLSAYDDAFAFAVDAPGDVDVLWVDFERFRGRFDREELSNWFHGRIAALRAIVDGPILVSNWDSDDVEASAFNAHLLAYADTMPGVHVIDVASVRRELGDEYLDLRASKLTGTRLSERAVLETARRFGTRWLPAALQPALKGIVVDLDNTLYDGVLGEDGIEGVRVTPAHFALQRKLLGLRDRGLFLAILSRNERGDVERLFANRSEFPLRLTHASTAAISWEPKEHLFPRIADALRVAPDALLYVDDNPGELSSVAAAVPGVRTLWASDATTTLHALDHYPGLFRWRHTEADDVRLRDLAAADERRRNEAVVADREEYLRSLGATVGIDVNQWDDRARLHELSNKTNQFNLSLSRLNETGVARYYSDPECRVVSIRLADRLSDSGLIGVIFGQRDENVLTITELCISCRALGRRLEDLMVREAIALILDELPAERVDLRWIRGPRNEPALTWLTRFASVQCEGDSGVASIAPPAASDQRDVGSHAVAVVRAGAHGR